MSMGLASWRAAPAAVSPGTSPSLHSSSPPPPPSYSATVSDSTRAASKKATVFCEVADAVYQAQLLQQAEGVAAAVPGAPPSATSSSTSSPASVPSPSGVVNNNHTNNNHTNNNITGDGASQLELPKIHVVRVAGLPDDDAKEKVLNAVTVACQTQLSEPTGRFFVFELPPVNYELWPSQAAEHHQQQNNHATKTGNNNHTTKSAAASGSGEDSVNGGGSSTTAMPEMEPLPPSLDLMQSSRVVCVLCPNASLCSAMQSKLETVFRANHQQQQKKAAANATTTSPAGKGGDNSSDEAPSNVLIDSIQRTLPQSCCLVVKASNSANRNHEAEIVPWAELMAVGAVSPAVVAALAAKRNQVLATATSSAAAADNKPTTSASPAAGPPSYTATLAKIATPHLGSSAGTAAADASDASSSTTTFSPSSPAMSSIPAPVVPSYFRLLRNERGVFRNALFLKFASQAKAELAMMYLERLCLCNRRIRVEHKKQSRGGAAALAVASGAIGLVTPALEGLASAGVSPSLAGTTAASSACAVATDFPSSPPVPTNQALMDAHVAELVRRAYDREGFSYPKRLLSKDDLRYLTELAAAHELLLDTAASTTHVTVMRPPRRGLSSSSAATSGTSAAAAGNGGGGAAGSSSSSAGGGRFSFPSPALGAQTPPWAPQTPPLAPRAAMNGAALPPASASGLSSSGSSSSPTSPPPPPFGAEQQLQQQQQAPVSNGSFSSTLASGTMQFRGLRHWREAREKQQGSSGTESGIASASASSAAGGVTNGSTANGINNNGGKDDGHVLPPMDLDAGAATKLLRALDPAEAERRKIAPWSANRGRRIH